MPILNLDDKIEGWKKSQRIVVGKLYKKSQARQQII